MKILHLLILLGFTVQFTNGQNQIPPDLKRSNVLVIKYSYDNWDTQFLDSTEGQWVLNRYGKEVLYKSYAKAFDKAVKTFKRHDIKFTVCDSRQSINKSAFNYVFDYKQKIVDNHDSIVADKHLGGFFFINLRTNEKYKPMVENKRYIGKTIRRGL